MGKCWRKCSTAFFQFRNSSVIKAGSTLPIHGSVLSLHTEEQKKQRICCFSMLKCSHGNCWYQWSCTKVQGFLRQLLTRNLRRFQTKRLRRVPSNFRVVLSVSDNICKTFVADWSAAGFEKIQLQTQQQGNSDIIYSLWGRPRTCTLLTSTADSTVTLYGLPGVARLANVTLAL